MKGVKYASPIHDYSGYSSAARNYIFSLHKKGVPITVFPRNFDINPPPISNEEQRAVLEELIKKPLSYDVVLIHLTPDLYPLYTEKGKYNIGFAAWETSLVHPKWASCVSQVLDELWVPCDWNIKAFRDAGVKIPIYKIPHGIDPNIFDSVKDKEFVLKGVSKNTFKFYSIFQWIYRKNPEGLLRSYFNAFDNSDDVVLILKAYMSGRAQDKSYIRDKIVEIKKDMNIGNYPRVVLIGDILSNDQMLGLHMFGDCFVSLTRGEGWGLGFFESGLAGNPVIGPNGGGNLEFMNKDNSYLIDVCEAWVSNMSHFNNWYLSNQTWYEPNQIHATELMREVFYNRESAQGKGATLQNHIKNNFSWDKVSDIIVDRLSTI